MSLFLEPRSAHLVHQVLEYLALAGGFQVYRWQRRRVGSAGALAPGAFAVTIGCVFGAAVGNKLVFLAEVPQLWLHQGLSVAAVMAGQSNVGGLLGGLLGVELAKWATGQRSSTGDLFVLPLIVGTLIGRTGCFLAGLNDGTFGNPTALPWAMDFGDGVPRHPTQLYDMAFVLAVGALLWRWRARLVLRPGLMFKCYLAAYLAWRLFIDGFKPVPFAYWGGLSGIQLVCLAALAGYLPLLVRQARSKPTRVPAPAQPAPPLLDSPTLTPSDAISR
jgi:prolipoprotein diacylglyceryltransferase